MKELSIEEKAERYDEAIKKVNDYYEGKTKLYSDVDKTLEYLFPALKESEDERIRKAILALVRQSSEILEKKNQEQMIAWLDEKQGEQKLVDKVEPKFHEGDWVTDGTSVFQIVKIESEWYIADDGERVCFDVVHQYYHLWTIQDAKDGNVLAAEPIEEYHYPFVAIYKKQNEEDFDSYCFIGFDGKFCKEENGHSTEDVHPVTKEQRDLLFQKMHDAGYEWDAEKKELKNIEYEIEIPFGAKDSELQEITYYIPKGFHAEIDDNEVVIKKGEKPTKWSEEDKKMLGLSIENLTELKDRFGKEYGRTGDCIEWLKSLKKRCT